LAGGTAVGWVSKVGPMKWGGHVIGTDQHEFFRSTAGAAKKQLEKLYARLL
jgi:hypothetical protein